MPNPLRRRVDRAAARASPAVPRPVRYLVCHVSADGTAEPPEAEHAARVAEAEAAGFHVVTWRVVRVNETCGGPARLGHASEVDIR